MQCIPCYLISINPISRYFLRYRTNHEVGTPFKPSDFSKDKEGVGIVVLFLHDLNKLQLWLPITFSASKTFGVFKQSLPFSVEIQLPKRGFVPGEIIPISGRISNQSDTVIKRCEIWIEQRAVFCASGAGQVEYDTTHHAKLKRPGIKARHQEVWNSVPYYVPCLPPSDLYCCKNISLTHKLILLFVPESGYNLRMSQEITIGNVPVKPSTTQYHRDASIEPSAPPEEGYVYTPISDNSHIRSVKYSTVSKPWHSEEENILHKVSNWFSGTESCPPRYPVFDLVQDVAERDFEFL